MRNAFRLGNIFGISIFVHFTWFVIFAMVTISLISYFAGEFPSLMWLLRNRMELA